MTGIAASVEIIVLIVTFLAFGRLYCYSNTDWDSSASRPLSKYNLSFSSQMPAIFLLVSVICLALMWKGLSRDWRSIPLMSDGRFSSFLTGQKEIAMNRPSTWLFSSDWLDRSTPQRPPPS